jgi:AraC family transcriptional regulator
MLNCAATQILNVGNDFGRCFQLQKAPSLLLESNSRPQMAATRLTVPSGLPESSAPVRPERGFTISVHLRQPSCRGWGMWLDGKFTPIDHWDEGGIGIYDLEANPKAVRPSAFDSVHFNLPRATLDTFTSDNEARRIDTLSCPQGKRDDVMFGLAKFILPWLGDDVHICDLSFDYFVLMFCSHVATRYGDVQLSARPVGGLVPWQQRRVMELIDAGLHQALRLSTLAEACGLSVSHFCRSFKQSFGVPAHRYVIQCRVKLAKSLLKNSSMPLAEIALQSGFSDQAAFSRAFSALVGTSPKRWLNEYKSGRSSRPLQVL